MDFLKLLAVFLTIIFVMWMKKPLILAILAATLATGLLYWMPVETVGTALVRGAAGWDTIQLLLVLYLVTFLQRMLETRGCLSQAKDALDGLFNSRRIDASVAPALLGMLPAVGTVLICGDVVRQSTDGYLSVEEQACVTTYFRHLTELFFPTYTSILIAISLTGGRVSVGTFTLAMLPMMAAVMVIGWFFYLRRLPKEAGSPCRQPRAACWKLLFQSLWTILFTVVVIVVFQVPVYIAMLICVVFNALVSRFRWAELKPFFSSAFEGKVMLNTLIIMVFKEVLAATGVIRALPGFFSSLPIPGFLIFSLIFFFGTIVAGSQSMIVLCMPMAMATASGSGLPLFILLMCMAYSANQLSPVHVCLAVCAENYHISLGALVRKTIPLSLSFCLVAFLYFFCLSCLGV